MFQDKFTDIITIGPAMKMDIIQIHMFFIEETMDLNCDTCNDDITYHILPELGP